MLHWRLSSDKVGEYLVGACLANVCLASKSLLLDVELQIISSIIQAVNDLNVKVEFVCFLNGL